MILIPVSAEPLYNTLASYCGLPSNKEEFGLEPVSIIVIETDGSIEALDVLKTSFEGSTKLGYNVFDHDFDVAASNPIIISRQIGIEGVSENCKACPIVNVCGGGYLSHRFSSSNGFLNPSIYCTDLKKIIYHTSTFISKELDN